MKSYRALGAASIVLMLLATLGAALLYKGGHASETRNSYASPLAKAPLEQDPLLHIRENFTVDESFASHLPIVVLDTGGVEPPISTYIDTEQQRYVDIEGLDPYVNGSFTLIDGNAETNSLQDIPAVTSTMRIKRRGNSSMMYEKAQWMVKLVTDSGQNNEVDLLGMGAEHEWILNGSMYDKSMLRNYLSYRIASQFIPYTPDSYFCEVLIKNGDTYTYQGVYLLCESIKQGPDRVNITDFRATETFNSYLVRRDRLDDAAVTLDNYGRLNGFSSEYMALLYPSKNTVTPNMVRYVEEDISAVERVIYSDDPAIFATYPDVIDVGSFIDYFLFNEFFGSYDAGNFSTYFYKDLGGKLHMGPVWDLDGTMDNYRFEAFQVGDLAFQTKPWFDRLCQDKTFLEKMQARYIELRQDILSERNVISTIDAIIAHLGGAQKREWARWGHWYTTENRYSLEDGEEGGIVLHRNATIYEDEIYRIKTALRDHANNIHSQLVLLEDNAKFQTGGLDRWMGWLLVLAAAAFFIPALFVSYRK